MEIFMMPGSHEESSSALEAIKSACDKPSRALQSIFECWTTVDKDGNSDTHCGSGQRKQAHVGKPQDMRALAQKLLNETVFASEPNLHGSLVPETPNVLVTLNDDTENPTQEQLNLCVTNRWKTQKDPKRMVCRAPDQVSLPLPLPFHQNPCIQDFV